ncbi:MAG: APC family permease [Acidimicrobiales bacterium]
MIGLGAMLGSGVFAVFGPAAAAAGNQLLGALALAGLLAYVNATSSARLAALHPQSGGTYVYGRRCLGPVWGYMAGWAFVVGKTASCAAMALTFGSHLAPAQDRLLATGAVLALVWLNTRGVRASAWVTRAVVGLVLVVLAGVVVSGLAAGAEAAVPTRAPAAAAPGGVAGIMGGAGLLFFAFAGYARITTLGEEVRDPTRTIPRAIPIAVGICLATYAAVAVASLAAIGPGGLAASTAPLVTVVEAGPWPGLSPGVRLGAAVASLGVLLSLLAGVGRTTFAMAAEGDLPAPLAAVHPRHRVPHVAEMAAGVLVCALVVLTDVAGAIGFSSFLVLAYYGVANASAATVGSRPRRLMSMAGCAGCLAVALTLPAMSVGAGTAVIVVGLAARAVWHRPANREAA